MSKKHLVLSLDHRDLNINLPEQKAVVAETASIIVDFVGEDWRVAVTHPSVPQVGIAHGALSEFTAHYESYIPSPLSVCSVMSRDYIGYDLQNGLRSELLPRDTYKCASTIMTEVMMDPYDEVFCQLLKTIGRSMTKEKIEAEDAKGNHMVEIPGRDYQHMVPASSPVAIVEIDVIKALPDVDQVVICCGDDGVPVFGQGTMLRGVSAATERDLTSGLLAQEVDAGVLLILVAVDNVILSPGIPAKEAISEMGVDNAKVYMETGQSESRSILPEVKAAVDSASAGKNRAATITSPAKAGQALRGKASMRIP